MLNKQRTNLGLEPYPYSSVFEGIFRLFQMVAVKVSFFKRNCNLSVSCVNDKKIAEIVRDWDEEALDALEARAQFFTERETDEESISGVSECDVCSQVSWETETEERTPEDDGYWDKQGGITSQTRAHAPLKREAPDEEHKASVWSYSDSHAQDLPKTEPNEVKANIVRECSGKSVGTCDTDVQVSKLKENKETVENSIDSAYATNAHKAQAQPEVPLEKEKDKETIKNVRDLDEKSFTTQEARVEVSTAKKETETGEEIVTNIGGWNEKNKTTQNARAEDSMEMEVTTGKETVQNVEDWDEKNVTTQKVSDQVLIESGCGEVTVEIEKDLDERSVNTHKSSARASMEKETGEGTVRNWNEENVTEKKENLEGNAGSVTIWDERSQTSTQVILEAELTASSTEFQVTDDEPGSSIPIPPSIVTYYDESQDSDEADVNTVILQEILGADKENEDPSDIENQNSADENATTGAWQMPNGRRALSDEENIYGRQDTQCIAPKKANSLTFCCANGCDEMFLEGAKRRDFVRFSGPLPLIRLQHHNEADLKGDSMEQQVENNEASDVRTQIQGALLGQEMGDSPEKESKKGKRRRRRRNNKRIALENPDSSAASEGDDELDKDELEQGTMKTHTTAKDEDNTKRKARDLENKTATPKTAKQPVQEKNEEQEAKNAEASPEKTPRKKVSLKKKEKAKKESPEQNDVTPGKRKTKFFRFLTRKNTTDSKCCDVTKENSSDLKNVDETRKNVAVPEDSGATIKKTADPKECDVMGKNTADPKNPDATKNTTAHAVKKKTADHKDCDVMRKKTADPKDSDAPKKNAAHATKKNTADPKNRFDQKKSNTSLSRSLSSSSVGSSKSVGVATDSVATTNVQVEEEKERDVLSLYDDID